MLKSEKILGFGEIMLRLTPPNNQKIIQSNSFDATYSGGEANVIISLSNFGNDTKFMTKLPNNNLGNRVMKDLRGYNVDVTSVLQGEGRLGTYYVEVGHGLRSTEVIYDRQYSAIAMIEKNEFDIDEILRDVSIVHVSGITPALSDELNSLTLELVKKAKEKGIKVSFDSNYRKKLWSIEKAGEFLREVLNYVDYAFLGYLDMVKILGYEDFEEDFDVKLEILYKKLLEEYPNIKYVASTKRTVNAINNNSLKAYLFDGDKLYTSNEYTFEIIDRIGGGDAFTAGILNGIVKGMNEKRIVEFAVCAGALKHSIVGDINFIDESTVKDLVDSGVSNIKR